MNNRLSIFQYQPTNKLVKILFIWWLVVVLITAIYLTNFSFLADFTDILLLTCQGVLAIFAVLIVVDILLLTAISQPNSYQLQRQHPNNVPIFHVLNIGLLIDFLPEKLNSFDWQLVSIFPLNRIRMEIYDNYPNQLQLLADNEIMPITFDLPLQDLQAIYDENGNEIAEAYRQSINYPIQPIQRGTGHFGALAMRIYSPFGLFRRKIEISENINHKEKYLRVLADFTGLLTNELSAVFEKSYDAGVQTIKEQGQGSEFLKLREYVVGDSMRQIDWKASSRQRRIMSKSYEEENDQDVIFLLDCGEQMRHKETPTATQNSDKLSYFDKVLNAILLLSYVANKQGDRVGLMTFGGINNGEEKFILPKKGSSLIRHLLNETADLMPTMQTSDYFQASERLLKSVKKRSLVIVITNTRQEANDELLQAMKRLSKQHQLVFANLTEQAVQNRLSMHEMPLNMDDSLLYHGLVGYQQMREKLHQQLRQQTGALCLACTANQLPIMLTTAYIKLKK